MLSLRARWNLRSAAPGLPSVRRPRDARIAGLCGVGYLAVGVLARRREEGWEARVLEDLNHGLGTRPLLRIPQQLGTPWVLPGIAGLAVWRHRPHLAVAAGLALPVEKGLEVGIKKLVRRRRPAQSPHHPQLLDDAPADGPSFPSGHVAIAFAATALVAPYGNAPLIGLLAVSGSVVGLRRVQQGAHFPLDSVGGALLGIAVGSGLSYAVGRPPGLGSVTAG